MENSRIRRNKQLAVLLLNQMVCLAGMFIVKTTRKRWIRPRLRKRLTHGGKGKDNPAEHQNLSSSSVHHQMETSKCEGNSLVTDMLRLNDAATFFGMFRMNKTFFEELLNLVGPSICKQTTKLRAPVSPCKRLLVTLSYLATGDDQKTIASSYGLGNSTVNMIVKSTCVALWNVLAPQHMPVPTEDTWKNVANDFWERWDYPNCIGAIDGKHVRIRAPRASGSVVMMIVADGKYRITVLDVGESGHNSDGGIFSRSSLANALRDGTLHIPPPARVPGVLCPDDPGVLQNRPVLPYTFVGDEAFPLQVHLMRPYPRESLDRVSRVFNHRLSRARQVVENVFGILSARWRFYLRLMSVHPETLQVLVKASCVLHNYLRNREAVEPSTNRMYCPQNFVDRVVDGRLEEGAWRNDVREMANAVGCSLNNQESHHADNYLNSSAEIRTSFANYFSSADGEVPWQYDDDFTK